MPDTPHDIPANVAAGGIVCTIPTYNEALNVPALVEQLLALGPSYHVLVIDDNSPDGTWRLVEQARRENPRLHLIHRREDRGRGSAGRVGFLAALHMGARTVVEMDADFSHHPSYVPALVERLNRRGLEVGLVLGSRGVPGGRDAERGIFRKLLTKAANLYIRTLLGVPVFDCNSGFRCWRREALEAIRIEQTESRGPAIVQELLFKAARARVGIAEVPIEFRNRAAGQSTLTFRKLLQGYMTVLKLRWLAMSGKL
jgi:dolichol-phosphate mannosyltransferase